MNLLYGELNYSFFDSYWALVHFISGIILGIIIMLLLRSVDKSRYYKIGLLLIVLWEIFESVLRVIKGYFPDIYGELKKYIPKDYFENESVINIASDLLLGLIGLMIIYNIFYKRSVNKIVEEKIHEEDKDFKALR